MPASPPASDEPLSERGLLAIAAHELNNALQSLTMRLDLIGDVAPGVRDDVDRVARLVRDYLMSGQLERRALRIDARPVRVGPLLATVRERAAIEFGGALDVDAPDDVWCRFDPGHLDQIVWHLVCNAFRHGTPPVVLTVRRHGDFAVFGLGDCGAGFAPDVDCARLHGRFSINGGGGIGLWLVSTLVEAYGGKLWLGEAWLGEAWLGEARLGEARLGEARLGEAECGGVHVGFSAPACLPA
ncbi:MAG: sensor histidine kinase [Dehalococcoidia bacterium]